MLVSGANIKPTASASPLASTHVIVFKYFRADAIDIAQIDSCRLDGVSEVLLMAAKFSKLHAKIVEVRYLSEASVTAKRERGWWPDTGIKVDRLRRSIRNEGTEHSKKRVAGAKQIPYNDIVQRGYFVGFKFSNRIGLVNLIAFI